MSDLSPELIERLGYELDLGDLEAPGPEAHAENLMSLPYEDGALTDAAWERLRRRARELYEHLDLGALQESTSARADFIASLENLNRLMGSPAWVQDAEAMPNMWLRDKNRKLYEVMDGHRGREAPNNRFAEDNATHQALINAWPRPFLESVLPAFRSAGPAQDSNAAFERLNALVVSRALSFDRERVHIVGLRAYQYGVVHGNAGTWNRGKRYDDTFIVAYLDEDGTAVVREFKGTTDPGDWSDETLDISGEVDAWMVGSDQQYCVKYTKSLTGFKLKRATWGPRTGAVGVERGRGRAARAEVKHVVDTGRYRIEEMLGQAIELSVNLDNPRVSTPRAVPAVCPPAGAPRYSTIRVQQGSSGRYVKGLPYNTPIHSGTNGLNVGSASLGCQVVHGCWFGAFVATVRRGLEREAARIRLEATPREGDATHIVPDPRGDGPIRVSEAEPIYTLIDARQARQDLLLAESASSMAGSVDAAAPPVPLSFQDPQDDEAEQRTLRRALEWAEVTCSAAKTQLESAQIILAEFEDRFPDYSPEADAAFRRHVLGPVWGAITTTAEAYGKVVGAISAPQQALESVQKLRQLWQATRTLDHEIAVIRETGDAGQLTTAAIALQGWGEALAEGLDLLPLPAPLRRTLQVVIRLSTSVGAAGARAIAAYFARTDAFVAQLFRTGDEWSVGRGLIPPPRPQDLVLVVDTLLERLGSDFVRADSQESRQAGLGRISATLGEAATSLAAHTRDATLKTDLDLALGGIKPGHPGLARHHLESRLTGHTGSDFLLLNRALLMARRLKARADDRTKAIEVLTWLELYVPRNTPRPAVVLLLGVGELRVVRRTRRGSALVEVATTAQLGLAPVRGLPDLRSLSNAN